MKNRLMNSNRKTSTGKNYVINCFLLMLPILVWNMGLSAKLPTAFQQESDGPNRFAFLTYGETSSRLVVFALTLLMPLRISTKRQRTGLVLYLCGLTIYFMSWLALIYSPDSEWSTSLAGFLAPAYTPFFWLMGIGLIGDSFYINLPYKRFYFIWASLVFLLFHNAHTTMIYYKTHSSTITKKAQP